MRMFWVANNVLLCQSLGCLRGKFYCVDVVSLGTLWNSAARTVCKFALVKSGFIPKQVVYKERTAAARTSSEWGWNVNMDTYREFACSWKRNRHWDTVALQSVGMNWGRTYSSGEGRLTMAVRQYNWHNGNFNSLSYRPGAGPYYVYVYRLFLILCYMDLIISIYFLKRFSNKCPCPIVRSTSEQFVHIDMFQLHCCLRCSNWSIGNGCHVVVADSNDHIWLASEMQCVVILWAFPTVWVLGTAKKLGPPFDRVYVNIQI